MVSESRLYADPLSDLTRKQRTYLLATSILSVALVKTGITPTRISALGVEFQRTNQDAFLVILALVLAYFIAAFALYAVTDFAAWKRALHLEREEAFRDHSARFRDPVEAELMKDNPEVFRVDRITFASIRAGRAFSKVRAVFEFLLPLAVGIYAVVVLLGAVARI